MKGKQKTNDMRKQGVQRCVIVQRDENGYGLTVSGDNPVFVQSIKEGSAAAKAGVQVNDQIIKVNGKLVAQSNHLEVVSLIKSGSFVALTLLGKDTNSSNSSTSSRPSSGHTRQRSIGNSIASILSGGSSNPSSPPPDSKSKSDGKVSELKRMLALEHDVYKRYLEEYMRHPTAKAQQELADSQTRMHSMEQQLKTLTGSIPPRPSGISIKTNSQRTTSPQSRSSPAPSPIPPQPANAPPQPPHSPPSTDSTSKSSTPNHDNGSGIKSPKLTKVSQSSSSTSISSTNMTLINESSKSSSKTPAFPPPDESDGHNFPFAMPQPVADINSAIADTSNSFDALFAQATHDNLNAGIPLHSAASVISYEEDEFNSEDERFDDHGPFIDLETLKDRPAHLAVFLHFLMSNNNPVPLLFWLTTDVYAQESGSTKELRKWAYEIYSTFIANNAPLKVMVSEPEEFAIEESFNPKTSEDRIKGIFDVSRLRIFTEVNEQLADFRNKRALGLGGLFGDHQLEDLDRNKEFKVIEQTLLPHLDALMSDSDTDNEQNDRNYAIAAALTTFLKQVGISKLERYPSFVEKEKGLFSGGFGMNKKKIYKINGHQFSSTTYTNITMCNFCDKLLWGIAPQGFQCQTCEYNVHKQPCSESLVEMCTGRKTRPAKGGPRNTVIGAGNSKPDKLLGTVPSMDKDAEGGDQANEKPGEQQEQQNADSSDDQENENRATTPGDDSFNYSVTNKAKTIGYKAPKNVKNVKNVGRSESVKTTKDNVKLSKTKQALPGIKSDFGVYGAAPFKTHAERPDSSPTPEPDSDNEPDSDIEVETENPNWQSTVVDKKILSKLKSKELKRQEVIHELIHTERTHVRNLKVLYRIFYKPLLKENIIPPETVKTIFPNLEELIEIHESLLKPMKELVKKSEVIDAVGELMLTRFDGAKGLQVKEACATFCRSLSSSLALIKKLQITKRTVQEFMTRQEANDYCRRLKFSDIMATSHQRLVKYPLLLDQINKSTPAKHPDYSPVEQCARCCRDILNHVNNEIKIVDDKHRLEELSKFIEDKRVLDKDNDGEKEKEGEGKFDISKHKYVMEGDLTWKVNPQKTLNLHVVLLDDLLVLLQVNDNGKFILKNHNTNMLGTTGDNKGHSPIIKLTNVIIREVAVDKTAFFMVSTSITGPQIYELVAQSRTEKIKWTGQINKAAELMKAKDTDRGRRGGLTTSTSIASPAEERRSITKQSSSVDETQVENLVSPERLQELQNELASSDEELKKLLERRMNIIAEMRGQQSPGAEKMDEKAPQQPRDIVLAAIAQTKRLTESVNAFVLSTKDVSTAEQRNEVTNSTTTIQGHLTTLLKTMKGGGSSNGKEKGSSHVTRSKSLEKPDRKSSRNALKNESSASTSAIIEPVISHARSHSSPAHVLDMNAVGPGMLITSDGNLSSGGPSANSSTSELPPMKVEHLVQNPFKMLKKRTSEPTMEPHNLSASNHYQHNTTQLGHNSIEVKPMNRAASFSGFSTIPKEPEPGS
ncbi:rho guanine nucleotide exchange factor 12-like isoform X3 [Clytia hemisphaerica]|uniref:Rho guanine nucleotide exchange factor 12 n=1 Tax=Clytia hemisphaerica TaxID=252671 RepID=A0A7M5WJZ0_9CNID